MKINSAYLCSFHIPKTGGTTFAYHARKSLGDDKFLLHGPFARSERFFNNLPQVEEMSDENKAQIKIIHGHGAGLALAKAMTGCIPELMVVLRDPYTRFVSGFNHFNNERKDNALPPVTEDEYFKSHGGRGGNVYAKLLLKYFAPLAAQGNNVSIENLMPILQSFKYMLLTEHMNSQLPTISRLCGLNKSEIETRRINKSKVKLAIDIETFERCNSVDREIYSVLDKAADNNNSLIENPFGYVPMPLLEYLETAWSKPQTEINLIAAYEELIEALKKTRKLQAAYFKLRKGTTSHVRNPGLLSALIGKAMDSWLSRLTAEGSSSAYFLTGVMFMNEGDKQNAEDYFRESVRLNPQNDNSLARLAQSLYRRGENVEAKKHIIRAMELRPDRPVNQEIFKVISGK